MLARLTIHFAFRPTRSFLIQDGARTVIGRDPKCDIVLDDDRVSHRHAQLAFADGAWRLADLDSKNGTSIQGMATREAALGPSGWISFGGLLARFEHSTADRERADATRREERHRTSISLQRELSPSLGMERLLARFLESVLTLSEAERGAVFLLGDDGALEIATRRDIADTDLTSGGFFGSITAIERAVATARVVAVSDAAADPVWGARESVIAGGIRSLLCVPLVASDRLLGVIYADSRRPGTSFGELDVQILEGLAAHASLAIALARADRELKGLAARLSWADVVRHHRSGEPS
jgi:hypothetical protein